MRFYPKPKPAAGESTPWKSSFALFPVRTNDKTTVWLEKVYKRKVYKRHPHVSKFGSVTMMLTWVPEYELPEKVTNE